MRVPMELLYTCAHCGAGNLFDTGASAASGRRQVTLLCPRCGRSYVACVPLGPPEGSWRERK